MPVSTNVASRRIGILSDYAEIYKKNAVVYRERQQRIMKISTKVTTRIAEYALKESIPVPVFWSFNTPRTRKTIKDRYITGYHFPFELTLPWNRFDEEDDVLGDHRTHLSKMSERFLQIPDRIMGDYFNATDTVMPFRSNAFDGVALVSDVDGDGNARFGVTGGNIVTSSGVGSTANINHDLFQCQQRFMDFRDTENEPFYDPKEVDITKFICIIPTHLVKVFNTLRDAKILYLNQAINTAEESVVHQKFEVWVDQRLSSSSNTWYCILEDTYYKPFFYILRTDVQTQMEDESNDHYARDLGQRAILGHTRSGMIPFAPMSIIQVSA